jgi:hypothetical protein
MKQSVQEIIDKVNKIVNPEWKFEMDDFYGDRGGIPYPPIETLNILHWKRKSRDNPHLTKQEEQLELIKEIAEIKSVNVIKIPAFGKYIEVKLLRINENIISDYNNYLLFTQNEINQDKINEIYLQLEEKVPKEFISWNLFNNNI